MLFIVLILLVAHLSVRAPDEERISALPLTDFFKLHLWSSVISSQFWYISSEPIKLDVMVATRNLENESTFPYLWTRSILTHTLRYKGRSKGFVTPVSHLIHTPKSKFLEASGLSSFSKKFFFFFFTYFKKTVETKPHKQKVLTQSLFKSSWTQPQTRSVFYWAPCTASRLGSRFSFWTSS